MATEIDADVLEQLNVFPYHPIEGWYVEGHDDAALLTSGEVVYEGGNVRVARR